MAYAEPIDVKPIVGLDGQGFIAVAATVTARVTQFGKVLFQVALWEAGRGQSVLWLNPADFETWRRSFTKPVETN